MLKLTVVSIALLAAVAYAEKPKTEVVVHHHHHHTMSRTSQNEHAHGHANGHANGHGHEHGHGHGHEHGHGHGHEHGHGHGHEHGHGRPVKIRQGGPSKIFGWLGSRFAKIPHYLPRMPHFPRPPPSHKLPQYQAIIMPDPPKFGHHNKQRNPEKVKITQLKNVASAGPTYHEVAALPEITENSYAPAPVQASYSVPEGVPQIEVVQSTLLYQNQQVIPTGSHIVAPASVSLPAPAAVTTPVHPPATPVTVAPLPPPPVYSTHNSRPSNRKPAAPKPGTPIVPQSTGPDYFDTAYKGGSSEYKNQQQALQALLGLGTPENNYGAQFEIQGHGTPQALVDPTFTLGSLVQQQAYVPAAAPQATYQAPQQSYQAPQQSYQSQQQSYQNQQQSYQAPQQSYQASQSQQGHTQSPQSIEQYANQALNTQSLDSLISTIADSAVGNNNNYGAYSQLSPQIAAPPAQSQATAESQQSTQTVQAPSYSQASTDSSTSSSSGIPGVQILSSGTDGGNPVFEVIADANAPSYNGHPFDINKLISLIEPGAELDSAELSHAASETKQTYSVPVPAPTASTSTTSGTNNTNITTNSPPTIPTNKTTEILHPLTVMTGNNNKTNSSLKDIMDFFQQTGGKGYVVVEKKRHRPDNLTLDFDQTSDDDLTNGPTRVNITSDMIYSQLQFLQSNTSDDSNNTQTNDSSIDVVDNIPEDILHTPLIPEYPNTDQYDIYNYNNEEESLYPDSPAEVEDSENNGTSVQENLIILDNDANKEKTKTEKTVKTQSSTTTTTSTSATSESSLLSAATPLTELTTLFEPVTSGKPAVFVATTPTILPDGETLNPNHNYYGIPPANFSTEYPLVVGVSSNSDHPTINPFLDAVDESVLDEPIPGEEEDIEGDLSVAESQQVSSIAITVTPPPRAVVEKNGKSLKGTTPSSVTTTTTTAVPSTTEIDPISLLATVTKKPTTNSKSRPAPVYRGKKN